jgi:putative ABC transport system permease protein
MDTLWQDLRFGLRLLRKNPGFTLVAIITLALGIGANTAIFSFVNSLFLRPLAVADPDRVVRLYGEDSGGRRFGSLSYPNYVDLRDRSQTLEALAAHGQVEASVGRGATAENLEGEVVTGNYFTLLGVNAMLGRTLLPEDDIAPGAHPVVVISRSFWQRRLGADPNAVGQTLYINAHPFTVVGVMPENFKGTYQSFAADFWVPVMMQAQVRPRGFPLDTRGWNWIGSTGRLKPGVTLAEAQAEFDHLANELGENYPQANQGLTGFRLYPASALPEELRQGAAGMLRFFMAVVGLVLMAACANIASLLLARMAGRRQEVAVRQSLGATRSRLVRQWLTESLLLALAGSVIGLIFAVWAADALMLLVPPDFASFSPALRLDGRVLAFTLIVSMAAGVLCGLFPALRASKADLVAALKEGGITAVSNRHRSRLQQAFVVVQVAISLVLLAAAGLLLRSLHNSAAFDPGFKTDNLLLARLDVGRLGYTQERGQAFYRELGERLKQLPGVSAVTSAIIVPLGPGSETGGYRIPGQVPPNGDALFSIGRNVVGPDYFATMGIPLVSGRDFEARDAEPGARPVIVINETMAREFWPDGNAIGQSIQVGSRGPMAEIVGVARDIKYYTLAEEPQPYLYTSAAQFYSPGLTMHIRTAGDPARLTQAVRQEVESLDPNVVISNLTTFAELRQVPLFPGRAMATVSSLFGLLTLMLAGVGIYGVTSYMVSQRTREVGIRLALGAQRRDVFRLVIGQVAAMVVSGIGLGLIAALGLTRFLSSLLYGVSATDPLTFAAVATMLLLVALVACYLPARRAMKIDPMVALRYE